MASSICYFHVGYSEVNNKKKKMQMIFTNFFKLTFRNICVAYIKGHAIVENYYHHPVAHSSLLLLQWGFHLFILIIPVDIKLRLQLGAI